MKHSIALSEDELVAYLRKTELPTILVEGTTDAYIYRIIEAKLEAEVSILPTGGRKKMLDVFHRRAEFPRSRVLFLADSDMWLFSGIPQDYQGGIIFTEGYSIENIIYRKDLIEGLMTSGEIRQFKDLLNSVAYWFGHEVEKYLTSGASNCALHINKIAPDGMLCPVIKSQIDSGPKPRPETLQMIIEEYHLKLRGRTLYETVLRFLSASKRESKYSYINLCELSASSPNESFSRLLLNINEKLGY